MAVLNLDLNSNSEPKFKFKNHLNIEQKHFHGKLNISFQNRKLIEENIEKNTIKLNNLMKNSLDQK